MLRGRGLLSFFRRFTKVTIPTKKEMAKTPPMTQPTIKALLLLCVFGDGTLVGFPSEVIVLPGTLREDPSQE